MATVESGVHVFSACRLVISIAEAVCAIDANRTRSFGYGKTAIKLGIRAFSEGSDLTQGFEKRLEAVAAAGSGAD
jgi:hypothetical protein